MSYQQCFDKIINILVLGDSYAQVFEYCNKKQTKYNFIVSRMDSASSYGLNNLNSRIGARRSWNYLINNPNSNVKNKYSKILIMMGEVDCGWLIYKRTKVKKISIEDQIKLSINNLFQFCSEVLKNIKPENVIICEVILPTLINLEHSVVKSRREIKEDIYTRIKNTIVYNNLLKQNCKKSKYLYLQINKYISDETNFIKKKFLNKDITDHHLSSENTYKFWLNELDKKILSNKTLKNLHFGAYHKTGSQLLNEILKILNINIFSVWRNCFNHTPDKILHNNKCIVLIRHPYEIICSGVRYHCKTSESWVHFNYIFKEMIYCCNKNNNMPDTSNKTWRFSPKDKITYQNRIKSLSNDDKILFEMNNCAYWTIKAIYNDIKNRNFNNNIYVIRLEDITDINKLSKICQEIEHHINGAISYKELYNAFSTSIKYKINSTKTENELSYFKMFKKQHYDEFDRIFPKDLFEVIGYKQ